MGGNLLKSVIVLVTFFLYLQTRGGGGYTTSAPPYSKYSTEVYIRRYVYSTVSVAGHFLFNADENVYGFCWLNHNLKYHYYTFDQCIRLTMVTLFCFDFKEGWGGKEIWQEISRQTIMIPIFLHYSNNTCTFCRTVLNVCIFTWRRQ